MKKYIHDCICWLVDHLFRPEPGTEAVEMSSALDDDYDSLEKPPVSFPDVTGIGVTP